MICPRCNFNLASLPGCPRCGRQVREVPKSKTRARKDRSTREHKAALTSVNAYQGVDPVQRERDYRRILAALAEHGELTRDGLEKETGIRINVITPCVVELREAGRIVELDRTALTRQRHPAKLLTLPENAPARLL